jgi:primosomal protein N' (replication factor Y)
MSEGEQLALPGAVRAPRRRAPAPPPAAAATLPVARVVVDVPLPHLDRTFDYLVPARVDELAVPGARVRLRFSGQLVDGFILDRHDASEHAGRLAFLERVLSGEPVLHVDLHEVCRAVADRWAGTLLAVPPRHARAEAAPPGERAAIPARPPATGWELYPTGPAFLDALASNGSPRAAWTVVPGADWAEQLAVAAATALSAGRGALLVVPDGRDAARLDAALRPLLPPEAHVVLTAELGPQERYRRWLRVRRGLVQAVIGTRSAVFAPVRELGLVAIWDDGDDVYAEPRAPYPHARDVLLLRAHLAQSAALLAGHARSVEAAALVNTGWAGSVEASRSVVRARGPRVEVAGDDAELARDAAARAARLPSLAWRAARTSLAAGHPVLIQVPRRGYALSLACARCRTPARCVRCAGPLATSGAAATPRCRWCGLLAADWSCRSCSATTLRATTVGATRTAEELGRAFPGVAVRTSSADSMLDLLPARAELVVATPGAEPQAQGGYGAALLLDAWALLSRTGMRAGEETLRRWTAAAALVKSASDGGVVVLVADSGLAVVQALVRNDPAGWAERELAERTELGLPPSTRMAALTGAPEAVADLLAAAALPDAVEVLGPVEATDGQVRAVLRTARHLGPRLGQLLKAGQAVRSARRAEGPVRVELDPLEPI